MTSDPLFPPSHLYSEINVLAPCFHKLLLVLLYCLEYSRVMALGTCFLSLGPHVPSYRQTQIVPPCVLTVPHLCFVPHLGTHVETVCLRVHLPIRLCAPRG